MVYILCTIPVGVVAMWAGSRFGLRWAILIAAYANGIGGAIRFARFNFLNFIFLNYVFFQLVYATGISFLCGHCWTGNCRIGLSVHYVFADKGRFLGLIKSELYLNNDLIFLCFASFKCFF